MIKQVCNNNKYADFTGLAIRVAYEVFWYSGERQSYRIRYLAYSF
jgi:hypothetical protein